MRRLLILTVCSSLLWLPAEAQVTVDLHALQALPQRPGSAPHPAAPPTTASPRPARQAPTVAARPAPTPPTEPPAGEAAAPAPPPALPESVPQTASIPPIAPAAPAEQPPAPPVVANAPTAAAPNPSVPKGLRVTFGPGQSDLSPDSSAAIKTFVSGAGSDQASFTVMAYAPGVPDDPSTARRVSLARAMAVRTALVADGIASARIFVRALGAQYGDGPPDRVDIDMSGANDTAAAK